jgi:hypothetical protein
VIAHRKLLNAKPSAFISVSLSVVLEEGQTEAQKYVDRFVSVTDWQPHMTLLLGGALRFTEYDYFQEQIVKFSFLSPAAPRAPGMTASSLIGTLSPPSLITFWRRRPHSRVDDSFKESRNDCWWHQQKCGSGATLSA